MGMTAAASRILARFGQAGTFVRPGAGPENPWDAGSDTTTSHAATVAVVAYQQEHRDGTLIQADDLRVLVSVAGLGIVPVVSDRLTIGAASYGIVRVQPLAPDGVVRFYDMQVRR